MTTVLDCKTLQQHSVTVPLSRMKINSAIQVANNMYGRVK